VRVRDCSVSAVVAKGQAEIRTLSFLPQRNKMLFGYQVRILFLFLRAKASSDICSLVYAEPS